VSVLSKARHRGIVTCHMSVAGKLTTHGAAQGGVTCGEVSAVYAPHELLFVCELHICE
jgi:hypothetical protein